MGNAQNRERHRSGDTASGSASPVGRFSDSPFIWDHDRRRHSSATHEGSAPVLPEHRGRRFSGIEAVVPPHHPPLMTQRSVPISVPRATPEPPAEGPQERRLPVVIQWKKGGKNVQLCGSFTGWKPVPMARSESNTDSEHMSIVNLPEGRHEYKFFIDGEWMVDNNEPTTVTDGDKRNFITVKLSDFTACDALNMETVSAGGDLSGSPPGKYGQEVPQPKPWAPSSPNHPPALPPHLLEVILNKDTPGSMEPTLLPAPNHVMLNHLYALSIKDGVMVLSATHRYRKKYVTTLLYKPI
ncbi:5'-AMP-activated protein kinase subunit beta-1 [Amphibalanus amphitrite]|uniref:5'-AMP-activated protein kinase subunit beta-1 n=1 Tax=Amphibalanus amphitrite TaxID=1232801 RepID=A0A6A4WNF7_AMPAM|nr:5'-AMP-activated protein kinase subunit beta-1-like [Amphibalanus amphitrite]XP_043241533.1 5'-AMP-activated protein kinase subunit beta-1-like [Amphibalanus amphitrite]XP_043241535.1 5'-AMP-activated protein kinase subunit beta-1-like [Amphibalanus amphitrite]KAF0291284.1 5'-AMP-activated protein kinase subunit beta-1 [Amphibalanus amphitrite]KAF0308375.1 5'-AMP-activated protein kinase subunit beta-1 [Amphibalanus amphitrite]